jgi:hypothetical protein
MCVCPSVCAGCLHPHLPRHAHVLVQAQGILRDVQNARLLLLLFGSPCAPALGQLRFIARLRAKLLRRHCCSCSCCSCPCCCVPACCRERELVDARRHDRVAGGQSAQVARRHVGSKRVQVLQQQPDSQEGAGEALVLHVCCVSVCVGEEESGEWTDA